MNELSKNDLILEVTSSRYQELEKLSHEDSIDQLQQEDIEWRINNRGFYANWIFAILIMQNMIAFLVIPLALIFADVQKIESLENIR